MSTAAFLQGGAPGRRWTGLPFGAAARALATRPGPLLIVLPTAEQAERFAVELDFHGGGPVALLPADDVRPWDGSPHPDVPRRRLAALDRLDRAEPVRVVISARALMTRTLRPEALRALRLPLARDQVIDRGAIVAQLVERGYLVTAAVDEPGTVAMRGEVLDVWPAGADYPVRIELFDDEIESVHEMEWRGRLLRSRHPIERVCLLPAREAVITPPALVRAQERTLAALDVVGAPPVRRRKVLADFKAGLWFPGAEDYLATLHPVVSPLRYAPQVVVIEPAQVAEELHRFDELIANRWKALDPDERPLVQPTERYASATEILEQLEGTAQIGELLLDAEADFGAQDNSLLRAGKGDLAPVAGTIAGWLAEDWQVALVCDSQARAERVSALLQPHGLVPTPAEPAVFGAPGELVLWIGPIDQGFHAPPSHQAVVTADEIFGARQRPRRPPPSLRDAAVSTVTQLKAHDLVVHTVHGVGRFERLKRIQMVVRGETIDQDFAEISYRDGDRMFLPVTRLDQLYRYRSVGDRPPRLDKLGGQTWERRKARVRDKVLALAHQVLELHAMRKVVAGHAYVGKPPMLAQLEETFPFVETPDQDRVIHEVLDDMAGEEPMDRLVIGDVGFGKTEVAIRAAMRVVVEGRQVAVLCPTTVLAFQHLQSFTERMGDFGVNIGLISRFRKPAEVRETLRQLREGLLDVVIGTHALLGRDARFKDLGLVIVDEEHRFGVKQKQQLKKLVHSAAQVPCEYLALSATPIPRTLHLALTGMRAVSLITTPPEGRRSVQTRIQRWRDDRVRDQILFELRRGGQAFVIHNRVQTIEPLAARLRELVPEATFVVAHGQMPEDALERVLVDFVQRRFHVLVCTTIVESGVDMPNVNTMLINEAHKLGLAQLYQLRGRVGRSHRRGYCTLLVPDERELTRKAVRRMRVLQEHTDLGAGFAVASADLELRGSGNLLGDSQHGHINAVGLETYVELLEEAVATARGDHARRRIDPELEVPVPALIPQAWIPDVDERLLEYRRLAATRTVPQVREVIGAWEDTWGAPPPEVLNLGWLAEARVRCRDLGVVRLSWLGVRVLLDFHEQTTVPPERVVELVTQQPKRFRLKEERRLEVRFTPEEAEHPFRFLHWVFRSLEG